MASLLLVRFKEWVEWSQKNPTNFAKFVTLYGFAALIIRYGIMKCLSDIPPVFNKLFALATFSIFFSIIAFYIRFYHSGTIKQLLSKIIDVDRVSSNIEKRNYVEEIAKKENPHLNFWVIHFCIPLILIWNWLNQHNSEIQPPELQIILQLFFSTVALYYLLYVRRLRMALANANVPLERVPIPSHLTIQRWYLVYLIKTKAKLFLRSPGSGTPSGTVLKATQYVLSPEFQAKAKAAAALVGYLAGACALVGGVETTVCKVAGCTTPSYMLASRIINGYFTTVPRTREEFIEIQGFITKEMIPTFIIPGTSRLDPLAVMKAYKKFERWENDPLPDAEFPKLIGPHPTAPPIEGKEQSFDAFTTSE